MTKLGTALMALGLLLTGITSAHAAETGKQAKKLPAQEPCETMVQQMEKMLVAQREALRDSEQEMKETETEEMDPDMRAMTLKNQRTMIDGLKRSISAYEKSLVYTRKDKSAHQCLPKANGR